MKIESLKWWAAVAVAWVSLPPCGMAADGQLGKSLFVAVGQSSDASATNGAALALDGANTTFSLTADIPGSYWTASLGRPYLLKRLELVNRTTPNDKEMAGLTLRLLDLDDQVVFQAGLTNPGSGLTNVFTWPAGQRARSLWVGLSGSQTNGACMRTWPFLMARPSGRPPPTPTGFISRATTAPPIPRPMRWTATTPRSATP